MRKPYLPPREGFFVCFESEIQNKRTLLTWWAGLRPQYTLSVFCFLASQNTSQGLAKFQVFTSHEKGFSFLGLYTYFFKAQCMLTDIPRPRLSNC